MPGTRLIRPVVMTSVSFVVGTLDDDVVWCMVCLVCRIDFDSSLNTYRNLTSLLFDTRMTYPLLAMAAMWLSNGLILRPWP